jgi:glycosyltransferase involved in cell wall biosynthesis
VVPGVTGFLAPRGAAAVFAGHIETLARDPSLRRRMGAAARARSLSFTWDADMASLLARYEALASRPNRAVA